MSPRSASRAPLTLVRLDPRARGALHRQIYDAVREAIVSGRLQAGAQLPPARTLARELLVARQTVSLALDQLRAEGYVETRERSGTFVSRALPDDFLTPARRPTRGAKAASPPAGRRSATTVAPRKTPPPPPADDAPRVVASTTPARPFRTGLPAVEAFPWDTWARLVARRIRRSGRLLADYGDARGFAPLRAAIATYVAAARGVVCTAEQVIVTNGAQQALDLLASILIAPGEEAWVEDPGYPDARRAFAAAGARLVPVPVDDEGVSVTEGVRRAPTARVAYVTPSHQYPLGATMSLARRLELLRWARESGAWIVEDDYDSEFRYTSRPLASLQGLDDGGRVVYVGTFSKTLFPALRVGYVVAPPSLVDALAAARHLADRHGPSIEQAALADFMTEGHFARHVRRMRLLYETRRDALLGAVAESGEGLLELGPSDAGMKAVAWLPAGVSDAAVAARGAAARLELTPISRYALLPQPRGGLLLGYAGFTRTAIRQGVATLAGLVRAELAATAPATTVPHDRDSARRRRRLA